MNMEDILTQTKLYDYISKPAPVVVEKPKTKNTVIKVFAVIGVVTAVAGIAFALYRYFRPDFLEDYDDEYMDDDTEDDFYEDSEE